MKYVGRLYGRVGRKYLPLEETTEDVEKLRSKVKELEQYTQTKQPKLPSDEEINNKIEAYIANTLFDFGDLDEQAEKVTERAMKHLAKWMRDKLTEPKERTPQSECKHPHESVRSKCFDCGEDVTGINE